MADAVVSAVLDPPSPLIATGGSLGRKVEQEVRLVVGVEKEVKKLKSTFEAIKDVLKDAENRQYLSEGKAVKGWLDELKHISFDIDDVLDEWKTAILKSRIERDQAQSHSTPSLLSKVRSCIPFPCSCFGGVALHHDITRKIKELNGNLQDIHERQEKFSFAVVLNSSTNQNFERPNTKSLIDKSKVFGRDHDKDKLVRFLLSDNNGEGGSGEGIPVIAIVGMGGLGKTTLAQLAYSNDEVKKHFSQRIWVCVSDPFDEVRIAKAILEALKGTSSSFNEPENLFQEIRQNIEGKKFLLVLDDVWTKDEKKWEPLILSLRVGSKASKILVTTRNEDVARILGCPRPFSLRVLADEDSWSLVSKIAFSERSNQDCENLESIGRKFVLKCAGLPLAIKTIASLLRFKLLKKQWERILVSEIWNLKEVQNDLFAPLLLSYYELPVAEKQCFRYCAIFPKDRWIERDEVIKLWMAQGFLGETREVNDLEIIGVECFNNLAIHGFFQEFLKNELDGSIRCKMHDIVHDFAQFLTKIECLLVESDGGIKVQKRVESSHEYVRHLTLINPPRNHVPILDPFKKLRSFLILSRIGNDQPISIASLPKLFDQLITLRVLSFDNEGLKVERSLEIPKEIGKLIHLRYLSLEGNRGLYELPEALCDLCNLQTLNIRGCCKLQKLPLGMEGLINLRHIQNERTDITFMPKGMQRLACLLTLEEFYVRKKEGGIKSETSFSLKELGKLIHLGGNQKISGLGNVVAEASEAREAQLSAKTGLRDLTLCFDGGDDMEQQTRINDEALVLEALRPPQDLQILGIDRCKAPAYPNWMMSLTSLKSVDLSDCCNWESLPPLGKLPSLESLSISFLDNVKKVGEEFVGVETSSSSVKHNIAFPNLKTLEFVRMVRWEEWEYEKVLRSRGGDPSYSSSSNIKIMPNLQHLTIFGCPELKTLPCHLLQSTALQELVIDGSPILEMRFNKETGEHRSSISHIPTVDLC